MWQPVALVFPDVELLLTGRLRALLAGRPEPYAEGVHVSNSVPSPRKDRMVIVRRDGGPIVGERDQARAGINVWATSEQHATDLARLVAALLRGLPDGDPILAVPSVTGPSTIPDESRQPRRYLTCEIHTRGVAL